MKARHLVYGLLDTSASIADAAVAAKCRDLTITWSRYDYHGPIIERATVDAILADAAGEGFEFCFIQAYGQVVLERWETDPHGGAHDVVGAVEWMRSLGMLAAGRVLASAVGWYGLDHRCLLIDVGTYRRCGRPPFGTPQRDDRELPGVVETGHAGHISLLPAGEGSIRATPRLAGWNLVRASLYEGLPVMALPEAMRRRVLDLEPDSLPKATALSEVIVDGIASVKERGWPAALTRRQTTFLESVRRQATNARRGVFLLNIEAYGDVDTPPARHTGPVSSLYAVASGFKPNRILQTHGLDADTRVVFFDYSAQALAVRRAMVEEWDGDDFPGFVRRLLERFPPPSTFYQLWADATPDTIDWPTFYRLWGRELDRLGGPQAFREHWHRYRSLPHEYVHCDVLTDAAPLLVHVRRESRAVMWFSNAPFTVYSNWRHSLEERKARYDEWIAQLAAHNPDLLLYGSDYNNSNVNCLAAGEYWRLYQERDGGPLAPAELYEHEIRM